MLGDILLRHQLANFFMADPEVYDVASRRIPYDYQKEIIDEHFDEALRISALRCVDVEAAPGAAECQAPAGGTGDNGVAAATADGDDGRAAHATEDSRLVVRKVEADEGNKVTDEAFAEFFQLQMWTSDDGAPMLDREGVKRCMGIGSKRHSKLTAALRDAGVDTRTRGRRVKERAKEAMREFLEKQAVRPKSISEAEAIRARFAERAAPHTGRLSTHLTADGKVEYELTAQQKVLFREMVEQWDSTECRMFSRDEICSWFGIKKNRYRDLQEAATCGRRQRAQNTSAAVKITERAEQKGQEYGKDVARWTRWWSSAQMNSPTRLCFACETKCDPHHCKRICPDEWVAKALKDKIVDGQKYDQYLCDYCNRKIESKEMVHADCIDTAKAPPALAVLTEEEMDLLKLVETRIRVVLMPKGGTLAQRGGTFVACLDKPIACDLLNGAEFRPVGGVVYCRMKGMYPGTSVRVRVAELAAALRWLLDNNTEYQKDSVKTGVEKALRRLAKIAEEAAKQGNGAAREAKEEQDDEGTDAQADTTYFTVGGPPPVGAVVQDLNEIRESGELRTDMEPQAFPHLFPHGGRSCPDGLKYSSYLWRRLLHWDPKFQQDPEYAFYSLETWFRKKISGSASVFVGEREVKGREATQKKAYAVLGKVPGTLAFLGQKRSHAVNMMRQCGRPDFFLTLTSHERQPHILMQCVKAHMRSTNPLITQEQMMHGILKPPPPEGDEQAGVEGGDTKEEAAVADRPAGRRRRARQRGRQGGEQAAAADGPHLGDDDDRYFTLPGPEIVREYVNNEKYKWRGLTALQLCQAYPADVEREFERQLQLFLSWITQSRDSPAESCPPHVRPVVQRGEDPGVADDAADVDVSACSWDKWTSHLDEAPPFVSTDYVCRVEWQKRGFPHAHIMLWAEDWSAARDAAQAAAAAPAVPRRRAERPNEDDPIWPFNDDEYKALVSGAVRAVRPRGNKANPGYKWIAVRQNARFEIKALAYFAEAWQVMSEEEWRSSSGRHKMMRKNRPYAKTYLVAVWAFQELQTPIPYGAPPGKAVGDHKFKRVRGQRLADWVNLQNGPPETAADGISSADGSGEAAATEMPQLWQDDRAFILEEVWRGERYGYVFKMGMQGLGYYLDALNGCVGGSISERSQIVPPAHTEPVSGDAEVSAGAPLAPESPPTLGTTEEARDGVQRGEEAIEGAALPSGVRPTAPQASLGADADVNDPPAQSPGGSPEEAASGDAPAAAPSHEAAPSAGQESPLTQVDAALEDKDPIASLWKGAEPETDEDELGPVEPNNVPSIYDVFVRTTAPGRYAKTYKDGVMAIYTKCLVHKHSPYCGKYTLGRSARAIAPFWFIPPGSVRSAAAALRLASRDSRVDSRSCEWSACVLDWAAPARMGGRCDGLHRCRWGFPQPSVPKTRKKNHSELIRNGSKNRFFVRRRGDACMMGMFNPRILRRWRASMDLQVVENSFAVARYILGYCLKNDTQKEAHARLQQLVAKIPLQERSAAQDIYRLAYTSAQGRVTSTFEACHLLLGLPIVRLSREFQWVHTGFPETYSAYVPMKDWQKVIDDPEKAADAKAPAVLRRCSGAVKGESTLQESELHLLGGKGERSPVVAFPFAALAEVRGVEGEEAG